MMSSISIEELENRIVLRLKNELAQLASPTKENIDDKLLTTKEVCELLQTSKVTLSNWRKTGQLKFMRFGKQIRYKLSDIMATEKLAKRKR